MTRNQIDWQNMLIAGKRQQEDARHNLITEIETKRSNKAREYLSGEEVNVKLQSLQEAQRSNRVNEWLTDFRNKETQRHNQMEETRMQLNDALQHMDRAEANRIKDHWDNVAAATRELERMDRLEYTQGQLSNTAQRNLNDYDVALKTWANDVARLSMLPWDKAKIAGGMVKDITQGVRNVTSALDDVMGLGPKGISTIFDLFGSGKE